MRIRYDVPLWVKSDASIKKTFRKSTNDVLVYDLIPNQETTYRGLLIHSNSFGMRDKEYAVLKPDNTFRIAVIGDSIAFGYHIKEPFTFPDVLETMLNNRFRTNIEVLNFGMPGYSTKQEIELYRTRVKQFHPDLVIVAYCLNDIRISSAEINVFIYGITKSYLIDGIKKIVKQRQCLSRPDNNRYLKRQFKILSRIIGQDTDTLVVIFPVASYGDYSERYLSQHQQIAWAADKNHFKVVDLLDTYRRYRNQPLFIDKEHPNKLGHRLAAEAIFNFIDQKAQQYELK